MDIVGEIIACEDATRAIHSQRFFKTGPGEYGEGDKFLGLTVPQVRQIARSHTKSLGLQDISEMLASPWHEVRQAALFVMMFQYAKSTNKQQLYDLYISQIGKGINNWDLVDVTCPHIVGAYLFDKDRQPLYELANGGLWQKRVAIISTFYFLRAGQPEDTYKLAEILVYENHDLLQKAVGWSMREVGKLDVSLLYEFLNKYAATMPRTALRYSLEKVNMTDRAKYMNMRVIILGD